MVARAFAQALCTKGRRSLCDMMRAREENRRQD